MAAQSRGRQGRWTNNKNIPEPKLYIWDPFLPISCTDAAPRYWNNCFLTLRRIPRLPPHCRMKRTPHWHSCIGTLERIEPTITLKSNRNPHNFLQCNVFSTGVETYGRMQAELILHIFPSVLYPSRRFFVNIGMIGWERWEKSGYN